MASLAQMERELIVERTRAGLAAARQRGRTGGRKRRMTDSKIESARKLLSAAYLPGMSPAISGSLSPPFIAGFLLNTTVEAPNTIKRSPPQLLLTGAKYQIDHDAKHECWGGNE
jgi:hypothetical protein